MRLLPTLGQAIRNNRANALASTSANHFANCLANYLVNIALFERGFPHKTLDMGDSSIAIVFQNVTTTPAGATRP